MSSHPYPDYERKVVFLDTHRIVNAGPLAYESLAEQHRKARLQRELQRDLDHDLRVIGFGLLAGYAAVCIFRLSQMGVL